MAGRRFYSGDVLTKSLTQEGKKVKTLAVCLIVACFVQTAFARGPATTIVRPASKLIFKNNAFAAELLKIAQLNTKANWSPTSLLNNMPNFTSVVEEGYIPSIPEMEAVIVELENANVRDINAAALRSAYHAAVQQGIGLALDDGTALEIGDNVPPETAAAVRSYVSYLAEFMREEGIEGMPEAVEDIRGENNSAAVQTGEAVGELLGRYLLEATEASTEVAHTELGELTISTAEPLPAAAMEFGRLMEEVRLSNDLSKKEFCTKLGIGVVACRDYVTFQRVPKLKRLYDKIIPGFEGMGVDGREVRAAWERANEALAAVKTTKPTPVETQIATTESTSAEEPAADGLTLKQVISQHRELLQQLEQQLERGEVSAEMVQIVRDSLGSLEALQASRVEAVAQLRQKMADEEVSRESLTTYSNGGQPARTLMQPWINAVRDTPLYPQLLAGLAENSEQAALLLEQYFNGERVLSEAELQQVCLHTACTVGIRPMLAVERVLDEYQRVTAKIGDAEELGKDEHDVFATALAVYKGESQVTSKGEAEIVSPVQKQVAAPVVEVVPPASAAQPDTHNTITAEQKQVALGYHKNRKLESSNIEKHKQKQKQYEALTNKLIEIMNILTWAGQGELSHRKLVAKLTKVGFTGDQERTGKHRQMTSPTGISLSVATSEQRHKQGVVTFILSKAQAVRFMEELQKFSKDVEMGNSAVDSNDSWKTERAQFIGYLEHKLGETGSNSNHKKLRDALNNMATRLDKMGVEL